MALRASFVSMSFLLAASLACADDGGEDVLDDEVGDTLGESGTGETNESGTSESGSDDATESTSEYWGFINQNDLNTINTIGNPLGVEFKPTNLDWGQANGDIDFECFPDPQ